MKQLLNEITNYVNKKYHPTKYKISYIKDASFTGFTRAIDNLENKSITDYDRNEIKKKGLIVVVKVEYLHKVNNIAIDCPEMKRLNSSDALKCAIYCSMKEHYKYSADNLYHLEQYTHFGDEYNEKMMCKHNEECKAYKRLENGGNEINDKCHMKIYRHPPRNRNIKLMQNVNALVINKNKKENHKLYEPTHDDIKQYYKRGNDGWLRVLMEEVIVNGFKSDLCLFCGADDECKHNINDENHSILKIVDQKINAVRHQQMNSPLTKSAMLSLILYTGCECNYDLCKSQRNGDYNKWKWFDYCLWNAIESLSDRESGSFSVYSGLNNVQLSTKSVNGAYFVTYVSTAWNKDVALEFLGKENGMMIHIDKEFKNNKQIRCCDISWISKFPDECEVLFARSISTGVCGDEFKCVVIDNTDGVQTVSLKKTENEMGFSSYY